MSKRWIIVEIGITAVVVALAVSIVLVTNDIDNGNKLQTRPAPFNTTPLTSSSPSRSSLQDKVADANLSTAFDTARATLVNGGDYTSLNLDKLDETEPSFKFVSSTVPSTGPTMISVNVVSGSDLLMVVRSLSGTCFEVRSVPDSTSGEERSSVPPGPCSGEYALQAAGVSK